MRCRYALSEKEFIPTSCPYHLCLLHLKVSWRIKGRVSDARLFGFILRLTRDGASQDAAHEMPLNLREHGLS